MAGLPRLLDGWRWFAKESRDESGRTRLRHAAGVLTTDIDCFVYIDHGSVTISTGIAPYEVVIAVLQANGLLGQR